MSRPCLLPFSSIVGLATLLGALIGSGPPGPEARPRAPVLEGGSVGVAGDAAGTRARSGAPPLVIAGGTLVDVSQFGASSADVPDSIVVVQDGAIVAAGPRGSLEVPAGARVLDASGTYVVPGLHDLFATVNNQAQANAYLVMGVTSIVGIDGNRRRGALYLDADPGPRIARLTTLSGYDESSVPPERLTFETLLAEGRRLSDEELVAEVERLARDGVRVLLLHYTLSPPQVRTVARRARELGLATIGELGATTYRQAIEAGVMAFVHTSRYSLDLVPEPLRSEIARSPFGPPRLAFYEHLIGLDLEAPAVLAHAGMLAETGVGLIPTLAILYLELPGHANPWDEPAAVLLDPADIHLPADRVTGEPQRPADGTRDRFPAGTAERMIALEAVYCRAGARYLAGSGTTAFGTLPGIALHIELKMLVDACLTPRQALAAATGNVGELFPWRKVGQLKPGYDADLLILEADPTVDVANLKKIRHVILAGELIDPQALLRGE